MYKSERWREQVKYKAALPTAHVTTGIGRTRQFYRSDATQETRLAGSPSWNTRSRISPAGLTRSNEYTAFPARSELRAMDGISCWNIMHLLGTFSFQGNLMKAVAAFLAHVDKCGINLKMFHTCQAWLLGVVMRRILFARINIEKSVFWRV